MNASVLRPPQMAALAKRLPLYLLIACLPFTDFVQNGLVAFNAAPVMGDIGASPEEYTLVATLYAVMAIAMISQHRWLVERLGWRLFVQLSCALFAIGALLCGSSASLPGFAFGRVVMGAGSASFMTAGRVLVNRMPPTPARFTGIRFFASGIAWGAAIGPLLASVMWSSQGWRAGFFVLLVPAFAIAAIGSVVLPRELPAAGPRSQSHSLGLLVLMGGSFALLHALQRSGFDFYSDPLTTALPVALALPALCLFVWLDGRRAHPLIRFRILVQQRYLVGLAVFGVAYVVLGANNVMLPVLLQRALGLPLDMIGRYLALGALAGVASWIVMARLLPKSPGPTRYYLVGFAALLGFGVLLATTSETAHPMQRVVPALLLHGTFVIVVLSTTAMQTFQTLQSDDTTFSHANQVKNMLAQFGMATGVALATLCMQWRSTLHYARLGESLSASNLALQDTLERLTQYFATTADPASAPRLAIAHVAQLATQEATLMASLDYFMAMAGLALVCLVLVLMERGIRHRRLQLQARAALVANPKGLS
jgi:DHA2 family multidrug resistance protein